MRAAIASGDRPLMEDLALMRCFSVTGAQNLVEATANTILPSINRPLENQEVLTVDLGPATFFPSEQCWIEWRDGWAAVRMPHGADVGQMTIFETLGNGRGYVSDAKIKLCADGFIIKPDSRRPELLKTLAMWAASLAVINSPRATKTEVSAHKGLQRLLRAEKIDVPREISHVVVSIHPWLGREKAARINFNAHPKAYHFCRAHLRRAPTGAFLKVRAHWRGDPAYGIKLPTYEVEQ